MSVVLPFDGPFKTIEVDFPWAYRDRGYNGFATVQRYRIHCNYPTLSVADAHAMAGEIKRVVAKDGCHLWFWTTKDFLEESFDIIRAWGFTYKQIFTWVKTTKAGKPTYGMGHWGRNGVEFLLFGTTKGMRLQEATTTPNYFFAPRMGHSVKPEAGYSLIRANSPTPRLSLFQRTPREGFTCWGNELKETGIDVNV